MYGFTITCRHLDCVCVEGTNQITTRVQTRSYPGSYLPVAYVTPRPLQVKIRRYRDRYK